MHNDYYLGDYKYKVSTKKIYKRVFWIFYRSMRITVPRYLDAVSIINRMVETDTRGAS